MTLTAERFVAPVLSNDVVTRGPDVRGEPAQVIFLVGGLSIAVHPDEEEWVAVERSTGMFGEGDNELEALQDLIGSLYALRHDLAEDYDVLSDRLRHQLHLLMESLPASLPVK